ncbi:MAG: hypothetical protein H7122_19005 [Chitinophagaceae bacterium]|nr:hypothetical protein [Chitinophagaceae bacterium]
MRRIASTCFFLFCAFLAFSQDDLLKSLGTDSLRKNYVTNAFKSSRVINGHSMEFIGKGVLDFRILHRFGPVNQGIKEFFGLDQASMRMGFDYGLGKNFTIGIGRTTLQKELDGFLKFRPVHQASGLGGSPVSLVLVAGMSIITMENDDPAKDITFSSRVGYYYQAIIGRKFNQRFTLQLSPTVVHRNQVLLNDDNDTYALGIGSRFKLSKRVAFVVDYFYVLNGLPKEQNFNPLSLGFDIETGGHVFQLHFSNASGMNERAFITETFNDWGKGDIQFGFNLSRVFTIGKKKSKALKQ